MSGIIGSCFGSFSASCLTTLMNPSCGDFRSSHRSIPPTVDFVLLIFPFVLSLVVPGPFVVGYTVSLILVQCLVVAFPQDMNKRYYGIRIAVPLVFGGLYALVNVYRPIDLNPRYLSILGSGGLGFVLAVCVSDFGFQVSASIRGHLEGLGSEMYAKRAIKVMIGAVCLLPIFYGIRAEFPSGYMHSILLLSIIALSITVSRAQRGSIVSAAITVYALVCLHVGILPLETAIAFSAVYNIFVLNQSGKDTEMLPDLPLLDDEIARPFPLSSEERGNVRFKFFASNMILLSYFTSTEDPATADIFFLVGAVTSLWILAAPLILTNRYFPT